MKSIKLVRSDDFDPCFQDQCWIMQNRVHHPKAGPSQEMMCGVRKPAQTATSHLVEKNRKRVSFS